MDKVFVKLQKGLRKDQQKDDWMPLKGGTVEESFLACRTMSLCKVISASGDYIEYVAMDFPRQMIELNFDTLFSVWINLPNAPSSGPYITSLNCDAEKWGP